MSKRLIISAVLMVALVLGFATQAMAATSDDVKISAQVRSKMTVVAPADKDFGPFDPDEANPAAYVATVTVQANTGFTLTRTEDALAPVGMFSILETVNGSYAKAAAPRSFGQSYKLDLRPAGVWLDPSLTYSKTFLYTATP